MREFTRVKRDVDGRVNFIDVETGKLVFNMWFGFSLDAYKDEASGSTFVPCCFHTCENGSLWRIIELKEDGTGVIHGLYNYIRDIANGLFIAEDENGLNVFSINDMKPVCSERFKHIWGTEDDKCLFVGSYDDGTCRMFRADGSFIGDVYDNVTLDDLEEGRDVVRVRLVGGGWNYLDMATERLLLDTPSTGFLSVLRDYGIINTEEGYNVVDRQGRIILPECCDRCQILPNGNILVKRVIERYMRVNVFSPSLGEYLVEKWYLWHFDIIVGNKVIVADEVNGHDRYNIIDAEGRLLLKKWVGYIDTQVVEGYRSVYNGEMENFVDEEGNLLLKEWYPRVYYPLKGVWMAVDDEGVCHPFDQQGRMFGEFKEVSRTRSNFYVHMENGLIYRLRMSEDGLKMTKVRKTDNLYLRKVGKDDDC